MCERERESECVCGYAHNLFAGANELATGMKAFLVRARALLERKTPFELVLDDPEGLAKVESLTLSHSLSIYTYV